MIRLQGCLSGEKAIGPDGALIDAKTCRLFGPKRIWDRKARGTAQLAGP
jgi:hypothetical protein